MLTELAKPEPDVKLTSKPVGAVTVTSFVKSIPEIDIVCSAEAIPEQVVKLVIDDESTVIVGVATTVEHTEVITRLPVPLSDTATNILFS